jgi:DNA-binding transcriptional ArsR family regulator
MVDRNGETARLGLRRLGVATGGRRHMSVGSKPPVMTEFVSDVTIDDIAVRDTRVSNDEEMTAGEAHAALADRGHERTENTIRHHINELREAGLVEVARLEEGRGGTTKYYEANTIVLSYAIPDAHEDRIASMAATLQPDVAELVDRLRAEHGEDIDDIAADMAPCQHCSTQKYETYLLLTVLRRALVRSLQSDAAD